MTNLEYLRSKIRDQDTTDQIMTDEELTEILRKNSQIRVVNARKSTLDGLQYETGLYRVDESYQDKVVNITADRILTDAVFDKVYGTITLSNPQPGTIAVETKVIMWNNVLADIFETIASDYRKLNSYTVINAQQNLDDSKSFLLRLARYYRSPAGASL